ncbi:MAG: hypothetical protein AAFZ52_16600 [Bacteroidota bacterium]
MTQPPLRDPEDDIPPILGSWTNIYTFVLVLHVLLLISFYLFSKAYA